MGWSTSDEQKLFLNTYAVREVETSAKLRSYYEMNNYLAALLNWYYRSLLAVISRVLCYPSVLPLRPHNWRYIMHWGIGGLRSIQLWRQVSTLCIITCVFLFIAGWCRDYFGDFTISLIIMAAIMFVGSVLSYAAGRMAERPQVPSNAVSVFTVEGPENYGR